MNEIFDSDRVDEIYSLRDKERSVAIAENRPTNYSVVRPELLDRLYANMYYQRLQEPNEKLWRFQILHSREVSGARRNSDRKMDLEFLTPMEDSNGHIMENDFDLVFAATGYTRDGHTQLLDPIKHLIEGGFNSVERDYRLKLKHGAANSDCGIWLQGCCESSHGVSLSAISVAFLSYFCLCG